MWGFLTLCETTKAAADCVSCPNHSHFTTTTITSGAGVTSISVASDVSVFCQRQLSGEAACEGFPRTLLPRAASCVLSLVFAHEKEEDPGSSRQPTPLNCWVCSQLILMSRLRRGRSGRRLLTEIGFLFSDTGKIFYIFIQSLGLFYFKSDSAWLMEDCYQFS